jgi:ubiquinone/menaquinone biosynthesis C-methylase UbiE
MSFAELYDQLMSDIDYEEIYGFIKPYIKNAKTIIDAGCGSGYLTVFLANDFDVVGLDIDEKMLSIARLRLEENQVYAHLYVHDLNDEIPLKTDAIVACFDVLNYFKDITHMIKHFYDALNEKGTLFFDVYKEEVLDIYNQYDEVETEPIAYAWHINVFDHVIEHLVRTDRDEYRVIQYVQPIAYYKKLLNDIGFNVRIEEGPDERKHYIIATK